MKSVTFLSKLGLLVLALPFACSQSEMAGGGAPSPSKKPVSPSANEAKPIEQASDALACNAPSTLTAAKQSILIGITGITSATKVVVQDDFGTATISGANLTYKAPDKVPQQRDVLITLTDVSGKAECKVKLISDDMLLMIDDGTTRALTANIYSIPSGSKVIPNLNSLQPIPQLFMAPNVNVSGRNWSAGFPGAPQLQEWFAIRFFGKLSIEQDGQYTFKFTSLDDGAVLYIDNNKVLDNDGYASVPKTPQASISLTKGDHQFKVEYFQGPRDYLGIILNWQTPGSSSFQPIPPDRLGRP